MIAPDSFRFETHGDIEFWDWLLAQSDLSGCGDLEKLLIGCELIAAVD